MDHDNPGFKSLREVFANFASKYDARDLATRAVRSLAAGGKAASDRAMKEFPSAFVSQLAKDIYELLSSQEVADGVSSMVRVYDEEKVKELLDGAIARMKDPQISLDLAKKLKQLLDKTSASDLEVQLDGMLGGILSDDQRIIFQVLFNSQIKPLLEYAKDAPEEEVAEKIREIADTLPTDMIAAYAGAMTREVTPEKVSKIAHNAVGKLPSPVTISGIVHGLGKTASESFGKIIQISDVAEVAEIGREFKQNAGELIQQSLKKDDAAKKTIKKSGDDFDL